MISESDFKSSEYYTTYKGMSKKIQSNVAYPKVSYPKSPIIRPWKFEMWLTKVDFLFAILNKTYNKNLRYLSLWVFDSIPCMKLVKTWVINALQNPRVGPASPTFSKTSSYSCIPTCSTLPILLFYYSTSMAVQRVYLYPVLRSK